MKRGRAEESEVPLEYLKQVSYLLFKTILWVKIQVNEIR